MLAGTTLRSYEVPSRAMTEATVNAVVAAVSGDPGGSPVPSDAAREVLPGLSDASLLIGLHEITIVVCQRTAPKPLGETPHCRP